LAEPIETERRGVRMLALQTWLQSRWNDDTGASMVEYALLVVLIAIVAIVAVRFAGTQVSSTFDNIGQNL
jgi:Flp pilus assembly pilin Flp